MRTRSILTIASLALLAGCTDRPTPTESEHSRPSLATYTITPGAYLILPGFVGSSVDDAQGINDLGEAVGSSWYSGVRHAVRWSAGAPVLTDVDGLDAIAYDVNLSGQIVGVMGGRATLWTPNASGGYTRTDLGVFFAPGSSVAVAINSFGQVIGSFFASGPSSAPQGCFLWTPNSANGTVNDLSGGLGGGACDATDINDAGSVVGVSLTTIGVTHAFLWTPDATNGTTGTPADLAPGDLRYSRAAAINNAGQVAGEHITAAGVQNAALWTPVSGTFYTLADLGTPGGDLSAAEDVDDAGFVVGYVKNGALGTKTPFFWNDGTFTMLSAPSSSAIATALTNLTGGVVRVVGATVSGTNAGPLRALRWDVAVAPVTPDGAIAEATQDVTELRADGVLSAGQTNSLLTELDAATRQLAQGNTTPAANVLSAFINEVEGLELARRLTPEQAKPLIDDATRAIEAM